MGNLWTPLFSVTIFLLVFGVGDIISLKTKGLISGVVVAAIIYIGGYWTGIIPTDSVASTGLPTMLTAFMIPLLLVNLGTAINLEQLFAEWKTVTIAIIGLVGLGILSFTLSSWLFTREYALCASSPIAGGTIAAIITTEAATAAGKPQYGAFAMLVVAFQMFIGMPVASYMLKKEANSLLTKGVHTGSAQQQNTRKFNLRFIPETPPQYQTSVILTCKVALIAVISYYIANLTVIPGSNPVNYILNPNIAYLLFGILFCEFGFLEKGSLQKANMNGFMMLGLYALTPSSFTTITPAALKEMLIPLVGTLIVGSLGIAVFSAICGKFLGYSAPLSIAIGMCALIGYPGTQIITDDVVNALSASTEEKAAINDILLPKMLVGGFATVTIASVIFAGIVTPLIF